MKAKLPIQILAFLVLVSTSLLSTSCEREIKRKKITGTYQLIEYSVDGVDSLVVFEDYYANSGCSGLTFKFYGKEDNGDNFQRVDCNGEDVIGFIPGGWAYDGNEEGGISILFPRNRDTNIPRFFPSRGYQFVKLKYKRMELETWVDGKLYRLAFEE